MQKSRQAKGPHPAGVKRRAREPVARASGGPTVAGSDTCWRWCTDASEQGDGARGRNGASTGPRKAATSSIGAASVCADSRGCNRSDTTAAAIGEGPSALRERARKVEWMQGQPLRRSNAPNVPQVCRARQAHVLAPVRFGAAALGKPVETQGIGSPEGGATAAAPWMSSSGGAHVLEARGRGPPAPRLQQATRMQLPGATSCGGGAGEPCPPVGPRGRPRQYD
jgi:hypothetical protein